MDGYPGWLLPETRRQFALIRVPLLRVPLVCSAKSEPLSSKSALRRWTVGPSVVQPYPVSPVRGDTSVRMTGLEPATAWLEIRNSTKLSYIHLYAREKANRVTLRATITLQAHEWTRQESNLVCLFCRKKYLYSTHLALLNYIQRKGEKTFINSRSTKLSYIPHVGRDGRIWTSD